MKREMVGKITSSVRCLDANTDAVAKEQNATITIMCNQKQAGYQNKWKAYGVYHPTGRVQCCDDADLSEKLELQIIAHV